MGHGETLNGTRELGEDALESIEKNTREKRKRAGDIFHVRKKRRHSHIIVARVHRAPRSHSSGDVAAKGKGNSLLLLKRDQGREGNWGKRRSLKVLRAKRRGRRTKRGGSVEGRWIEKSRSFSSSAIDPWTCRPAAGRETRHLVPI